MNFLKRAFLCVTKRKSKTLLMIIVLGIIANLVLAGLSIKSAAEKSTVLARQKLGGEVTLSVDYQKAMEKQTANSTAGGGNTQAGRGRVQLNLPPLTVEMADKLASLEYVAGYNYFNSSSGIADGFEPVVMEGSNNEESNNAVGNNTAGNNKTQGAQGQNQNFKARMGDISLSGTVYSELLSDFTGATSKLLEGRHIDKEDIGKSVVIIEKNLAELNGLKLGNKIKIKSVDETVGLELEIVGIYQTTTGEQDNVMNFSAMSPYNRLYVPYTEASKIGVMGSSTTTSNSITSAVYYMDDPLNVEKFKVEAEKTDIDFNTYKLDANDSAYKQMIGPINNVASFSNTVVIIVTIAGAVILALIIILSLKDRRYEIGVLLSIGEKRAKIAGQLIAETMIIACIAFGISTFSGKIIAQNIGNDLLQKEVKVAAEQETQTPQGMFRMQGRGFGGFGGSMNNSNVSEEPIDEIDVSVTGNDLQRLALLGILIVFVSAAVPTASVLRFNPKTILTKNQ